TRPPCTLYPSNGSIPTCPPSRTSAGPPTRKQVSSMKKHTLAVTAAFSVLALAACGNGSDSSGSTAGGGGGGADMRLALNQTEEHPSFIALDNFGQKLSEDTEDRYSIEVYPNEELGAQAEALQYVGDGSVDLAIVSGTQLENLNADFAAFNMPGAFDSV